MRLNLRCPEVLEARIRARCSGNVSESVRQGLGRYYMLLASSRDRMAVRLQDKELSLICDVCKGVMEIAACSPSTAVGYVIIKVKDCDPSVFEKWGVNRRDLMMTLEKCSATDCIALVDAVERYWAAVSTGMAVDVSSLLDVSDVFDLE